MPTVREASFDLFRARGMTTMFGNPGSTELPMLADFPADFRYVLGLQEAVVVGMADGYAQASGRASVANLHTAPGVGNAMGAIFNAQANHSPVLVTAGQQTRSQITLQANLTNRDAIRMPHPLVKWSFEPPRAQDVPLALAHGAHLAALPPKGPTFVSIPMDDWYAEVDEGDAAHAIGREVSGRAVADPDAVRALAERLDAAANPVLVAGPDIDGGGWDAAVALAERQRLPVWASPATGGARLGFPESHPNFRGVLPPAIGPVGQTLEGHDLIVVAGSSVFPYYPHIPGPLLPEGAELVAITSDPDEAARAPMGDALVADVSLTLAALLELVPESSRGAPEPNQGPQEIPPTDPLNSSTVHTALGELLPEDAIVVLESPASTLALRNQLRLSRPGSYYFSAGGGLGFGLAASIGVQLAQPDRPVVCVLGEASTCPRSTSPRSPPATASPPGLWRVAGTRSARRSPRRSPPRGRSWWKSRSSRGCHSSRAMLGAPLPASTDRAPDTLAGGTAQPLRGELESLLGADRVLARASDIVRYASDASPYRLLPQAVVMAHDPEDVAKVLDYGRRSGIPVVFRAAGTSLNGQGQSDGILVDVRRHFGGVALERGGELARVRAGTVLGHANRVLAPHGRKLGPDPASTDIATVGGVIANNSGGMRCGTTKDSYSTVRSMKLVLASGTVVDTAEEGAAERFATAEPELVAGLEAIRDEIRADDG